MKALRYYIRTYDNPDVRFVDLRKAAPTAKAIQFVPLNQPQVIRDLTP
jgi:penicillin V acylase-like amidase (Ntn superfamily)